jgi:cell division control protein 6
MKIANNKDYESKLKIAFINSTSISSIGAVYKKICSELDLKVGGGGSERDCLAAIEKYFLSNHTKTTLLVLDEIDQLCSAGKEQKVLYNIFEWPSIPNSKLILIGIANSLDLTDRLLVRLQAKCDLKPKVMHFPAYTKNEIIEIFKSRLEESDLFPPAAVQLLAAKVAAVSGDIRRALNIGKRVIELAELERKKNSEKTLDMKQFDALVNGDEKSVHVPIEKDEPKIQLKEVMSVLNNVYGCSQNLSDDVDDAFPLQQKILICTMLLIMKNDKNKDVTIGRLHDVYKRVCRSRNILATDLSEFVNLCLLVETRGILRLTKKKEPRFHRVHLQWNEDEVYSTMKDKQMITNILNDQSLLGR